MESHQTDLILDTPRIINKLSNNEDAVLFVGKSHADLSDRFMECLDSHDVQVEHTIQDCFEYCMRTLGCDFVVIIHPNLHIGFQQINISENEYSFRASDFRYGLYGSVEQIRAWKCSLR